MYKVEAEHLTETQLGVDIDGDGQLASEFDFTAVIYMRPIEEDDTLQVKMDVDPDPFTAGDYPS